MNIDRLEELNKQIANLREKQIKLQAIRDAKIELIKLQFGNIPTIFAARHPVLSALAVGTGRTGYRLGSALYKYANRPQPKRKAYA